MVQRRKRQLHGKTVMRGVTQQSTTLWHLRYIPPIVIAVGLYTRHVGRQPGIEGHMARSEFQPQSILMPQALRFLKGQMG